MCAKSKEAYILTKTIVVRPAGWLLLRRKGILFLCMVDY